MQNKDIKFIRKNGRIIPISVGVGATMGAIVGSIQANRLIKPNKRSLVLVRKKFLENYAAREGAKFYEKVKKANVFFTKPALKEEAIYVVKQGKKKFKTLARVASITQKSALIGSSIALGALTYGASGFLIDKVMNRKKGK